MTSTRAGLAALILLASAATAQARGQWYVSGGGDHFNDGFNGGDINVGWQINRHYAIEMGLTIGAATITDGDGYSVSAAIAEFTFDGYGFLPLGRGSRVSLFGTAGLTSVGLAASDGYDTVSAHGAGVRAGAGLDWRFSRDMHFRAAARYQFVSVAGYLGSDAMVNAQLVYFF